MKSYKPLLMGAVIVLGVISVPSIVVHADAGVVTNDFSVKDNAGNIVKEFKSNEEIKIDTEAEQTYKITVNHNSYEIDKGYVLKTIKHEEESLTLLQENITLKTSPDLFGSSILEINKGEVVHRIPEVAEQNGFVKVRTFQSIEGWVLKSALKQNVRNVLVQTKAFINSDSEQAKSLFYGDSVTIIGFEENQYKLELGENELLVNKESVSFTEPSERNRFEVPVHTSNPASLITSLPGWRTDPVYGGRRYHGGIDLAVPKNTPIYATADGYVVKTHTGESYNNGAGYGNYIKLGHAEDVISIYAHLTSLTVKEGEKIRKGQLIGYSGSTGKSTGYHLHFQMEQNGVLLDTSLIIKGVVGDLKLAPR